MVGIVLEGQIAVEERQRLLEDGSEISVVLRERDAQGKKSTTMLQFGMNGSVAWVWCQEDKEGSDGRTVLEEVLVHEAVELFRGYLERMELRRCLVDSSPLSPAIVEIEPSIQDVVANLAAEFGITVPLG